MIAALTDWFYRVPAVRVAEARLTHGADTLVLPIRLAVAAIRRTARACHALEMRFVFDNLGDPLAGRLGRRRPAATGRRHARAWAISSRPETRAGPPTAQARRAVVRDRSKTVTDPRAAERRAWDGVR